MKELDLAEQPIMIKLHIQKKYFDKNRTIVPAFYGFWINDKEIKSDEIAFETNKKNKGIIMTIAFILSAIGIFSLLKF